MTINAIVWPSTIYYNNIIKLIIGFFLRHRVIGYLITPALVVVGVYIQYFAHTKHDVTISPFASSFLVVSTTSLFIGGRPGIIAAIVSAMLSNFVIMEPHFQWSTAHEDIDRLSVFLISSCIIIAIGALFRRSIISLHAMERSFDDVLQLSPTFICVLRGPNHIFELANAKYCELVGRKDLIGKELLDALPEVASTDYPRILDRVYATGRAYKSNDVPIELARGPRGELEERWLNFDYIPLHDLGGNVSSVFVHGTDITDYRQAARIDPMTNMPNQRAFRECALKELRRLQRYNKPLSVILIDVDFFKNINDTLGHHAGDNALRIIGQSLIGSVRSVDIPARIESGLAARIGGDEFALLLPETDQEGAKVVMARFQATLAKRSNNKITCSIGCCTFTKAPINTDTLLRIVDKAMYRAKTGGRNRVVFCTDQDANIDA